MVDRRLNLGTRRSAFRPSSVFVGLVALWITGGLLCWLEYGSPSFNVILFVVAGWLVSLSLHEYSHAIFAYRAGDREVAERGYLTLNLLKYTHPILSVVFPVIILLIGGIGLPGGAVFINRGAVRTRLADALISLAGPAVNLVFTVALVIPFAFAGDLRPHLTFWAALAFLAFLQLTASLLNLLPVPGLDGGNAVRPYLGQGLGRAFDVISPFGMMIVFLALFDPRINERFFTIVFGLGDAIGLPSILVEYGRQLLQFWT